jgi:hypothetical protein
MKRLNELFDVSYGTKLDLNKMRLLAVSNGGVHFVGRSSVNHGVSAEVAPLKNMEPYEGGLITVALGGTKLLSSFVQQTPFYTAQNVAILRPKAPMSFAEKLFMCLCIRHNRFRYSAFGREAKFTLTPAIALFIATLIRLERYRFNYGRKWHLERMVSAVIRLPAGTDGTPNWPFIEQYILSLPFSSQIVGTAYAP